MEEYICDVCNGTGKIFDELDKSGSVSWTICNKCQGEKKLNWLENIFGVEVYDISEIYSDPEGN